MKRIIITAAAIALAYLLGRSMGVQHAMCDAEHWILDASYVDGVHYTLDTADSDLNGGDFRLVTILDGQAYENFGFIG